MRKTQNLLKKRLTPYIWILPALLMFCIFIFYPISFNVILSFFKWDGFNPDIFGKFVFLDNFKELFKDKIFIKALTNTLIWVMVCVTVQNIIAMFTAIFLYIGKFRGSAILRGIIFFPAIVSGVIVSLVWRPVFLEGGGFNMIVSLFSSTPIYPLGMPNLAFYVVMFVSLWQWSGFNMIIFYAGLQSIEPSVLEAAEMDGASFWSAINRVIIPLLKPVIIVCVILNVFGGFKIFDVVFIMTGGGPIHSSEVLTTFMVDKAFKYANRMGYASSVATFMVLIMGLFAFMRIKLSKSRGEV